MIGLEIIQVLAGWKQKSRTGMVLRRFRECRSDQIVKPNRISDSLKSLVSQMWLPS